MKTPHLKSWMSGCVLVLLVNTPLKAQSPVEAIFTSYTTSTTGKIAYTATPAPNSGTFSGCVKQSSSYSFTNGTDNGLLLTNIIANGYSFPLANNAPAIIKLRRVNNASVTGQRHIIFLESTTVPAMGCPANKQYRLKSSYQDNMELFLNNNYVNQGTDNIFTNAGNSDGNNNNIERVDVIFPNGISSSKAELAGFALFDRGIKNAHDPFRIAAITAINTNGDPTAFGPVRTCLGGGNGNNGSWGHPTLQNGNRDLSVYVMRKETNETQLRSSAAINQQLGGVFFSLADLGVQANQVIYGYALLSTDGIANPTSSQLLNLNDQAVYPLNTSEAVGGGLDLIAVNAFFQSGTTLLGQEITLKGSRRGQHAVLQWTLKEWPAHSRAELQQSNDGSHFTTIQSFTVPSANYTASFTDPIQGTNYYRLKLHPPDKQLVYSNTVQVKGLSHSVQLYPTRIQTSQSVNIKGLPDGVHTVRITAASGTTYMAAVRVQNGMGRIEAPLSGFARGVYYISVKGAAEADQSAKLVVY